jgi:hypothetical protein
VAGATPTTVGGWVPTLPMPVGGLLHLPMPTGGMQLMLSTNGWSMRRGNPIPSSFDGWGGHASTNNVLLIVAEDVVCDLLAPP